MTEHTASFQVTTGQAAEQRTFWPTDYGRLARGIKRVRAEAGSQVADLLVAQVSAVLGDDSAEFDAARFAAATYDVPAYVGQLAEAVRRARHVMGRSWEPKAAEHQQAVDALAAVLADGLQGQVPGFDGGLFHAGSRAPEQRADEPFRVAKDPFVDDYDLYSVE